jgi:hypothetical protein
MDREGGKIMGGHSDVVRFQITVDYVVVVQIGKGGEDLGGVR